MVRCSVGFVLALNLITVLFKAFLWAWQNKSFLGTCQTFKVFVLELYIRRELVPLQISREFQINHVCFNEIWLYLTIYYLTKIISKQTLIWTSLDKHKLRGRLAVLVNVLAALDRLVVLTTELSPGGHVCWYPPVVAVLDEEECSLAVDVFFYRGTQYLRTLWEVLHNLQTTTTLTIDVAKSSHIVL